MASPGRIARDLPRRLGMVDATAIVVGGDEDDVVAVEDRDRGAGGVDDTTAGHQREDLVDRLDGLGAADRAS